MRRRIVTLAIAAAVLAISLFGLPLAAGVAKYNLDAERTELERMAARAALTVAAELPGDQPPSVQSPEPETVIGLYSPDGALRSGNGPSTSDQVVRRALRDQVADGSANGDVVVAVPIDVNGTLVGVVRAATPYSEVMLRTGMIWLAMAGLAAIAVVPTWLVARRMAARLAHPLEDLSAAAGVLGDGDFTVRTARTGIPEIDAVGMSLDTTAQRLGETLERERSFSASASHQLRTPLAGLRLQLEAALETPDMDLRAAIRAGIDSADRLERTVTDLLALARRNGVARGPVADVAALLADVRTTWHTQLASEGRDLTTRLRAAPQPRAAEAALRQILNVLVDNAFTHGSGNVTVTARDAGETLAVDVADEGTGIDEQHDPFTRQVDGHGIGLSLARSLAEAENGRLILSSATPTCFTLLLPTVESP
ncbi:sensor histidine kinase [Actinocrispum wychmicini]|uniref:histidine kinase n=1 Tax=Actinocrispum wychmicini TaxID=1213861 RepID=A0A4R2JF61_9PSEU|nr:HAMP domain-containing sensor histidine kinase [Actinocrispum wychmicini]TCO54899.1 signal transduction histidine kinase [Actinocrispum wychmicini]